MTFTKPAVALAALFVMSGCAVMNTQQCIDADWYDIGVQEGRSGRSAASNFLEPYYKACSKAGVTPDAQAYEAGRASGARYFCRADNGFPVGRRGGQYNGVCDVDLEDAFLAEFEKGQELYRHEEPLRQIEQQISELEEELESQQSNIRKLRSELQNNDELSREERQNLRDEILRDSDEVRNLENRLDRLDFERILKQERLDEFKSRIGYY